MKISEIQQKDIIRVSDCRKLGKIIDLEMDSVSGQIKFFVVSSNVGMFHWFTKGEEVEISFKDIVKIGEDAILVRLDEKTMTKETKSEKE